MENPLWLIAKLPDRPYESEPWKAGMIRKDGAMIGVQLDQRLTHEEALLVIQQFAGILTPHGLERMMEPI